MKKILVLAFAISSLALTGCEVLEQESESNVFEILDLEYDGPSLDNKWFLVNDYYVNGIDPNTNEFELQGTGKAFEVTLKYAVDGDTAHFNLPTVYDEVCGNSSFRFLNMDTEETYSGGEEEWGKPASEYTKELLTNAYSIALQNDPNEGIYDIYGRGLAWIWVKESATSEYELLNYKVIQQGLARTAYLWGAGETIYYGDLTYTEWMLKAESDSVDNKRGMHSDLIDPYWDYENNGPNSNWCIITFKEEYLIY